VKNKLSIVQALILYIVISSVSFSVFVLSSEMVFARNHELFPPILNKTSLNFFNSLGANLGNKHLTADNGLPPAVVTPSEVQVTNHGEKQITFAVPIPFNTTAAEIFDKYMIQHIQLQEKILQKEVCLVLLHS
jgi:hypothetical protein